MKKLLIALGVLIVIAAAIFLVCSLTKSDTEVAVDQGGDSIFFWKHEAWGPCPIADGCYMNISVYTSGRVTYEMATTTEKQMDAQTVAQMIGMINKSGFMKKDCSAAEPVDYSATYRITLNGKVKEITFPGCEDELKGIEALLPKQQ